MAKAIAVKNKVFSGGNHAITLDYGNTYSDGSFHKGLDLVTGKNIEDTVCAFADGTVVGTENTITGTNESTGTPGMGNYVILEHANGWRTRYQHLKTGSVRVAKGQKVKKGQIIGTLGNTGNSRGRHLHFDISQAGQVSGGRYITSQKRSYFDPKPYLQGAKTITPTTSTKATHTVTASALRVRKGPGTNYTAVDKLNRGDKVTVTEKADGFGKIGKDRWVAMDYLKEVQNG